MILLLGGTADTAPLATLLAEAGYNVLVSTATDVPLATGDHPRITRRTGPLDQEKLVQLLIQHGIRAVIDAAHPYAAEVHRTARAAAAYVPILYLAYLRPAEILPGSDVIRAGDHEEAARLAFAIGRPVLLTTGSRNLLPYAVAARKTGETLIVRVLDHPESLQACREAGILPRNIIAGRGPFSIEDNIQIIKRFSIGVLVTKDSGKAGGVDAKREAARREGCALVVVLRPLLSDRDVYGSTESLLRELRGRLSPVIESTSGLRVG